MLGDHLPEHAKPNPRWSFKISAALLLLWLGPVAALLLALGPDHVFTRIALFFSQMAVVTFGGAYAVLAYVAQEAVQTYHWLAPGEMLDGLAMAETTPGPLIMVTQFVGFMGAYRQPGALDPLGAATLGAVLTTWVTFVPCFFGFSRCAVRRSLRGNRALTAALAAITAAVVGVILNLALWFALHALFRRVEQWPFRDSRRSDMVQPRRRRAAIGGRRASRCVPIQGRDVAGAWLLRRDWRRPAPRRSRLS